jgi:hypothetical protein
MEGAEVSYLGARYVKPVIARVRQMSWSHAMPATRLCDCLHNSNVTPVSTITSAALWFR